MAGVADAVRNIYAEEHRWLDYLADESELKLAGAGIVVSSSLVEGDPKEALMQKHGVGARMRSSWALAALAASSDFYLAVSSRPLSLSRLVPLRLSTDASIHEPRRGQSCQTPQNSRFQVRRS